MAAKGSVLKEQIANQILSAFPGSFKYDKEIRIPGEENGEMLQIKVTLTCAKVNVEVGEDTAMPGATKPVVTGLTSSGPLIENVVVEPTQEEKDNVEQLLKSLGL